MPGSKGDLEGPRRRLGHPVRVQDVREQLQPLDEPRPGAREVGRRVDRDHPLGAELLELIPELERLVDGLETLAHVLHPDKVPEAPSKPLVVAL